jgi:DNA-binding transcriptional LysR family regulator
VSILGAIEFFQATVETGSFASAARKLQVTPSAVSRRIAALESELGVQLLVRTTRSLRLTEQGKDFHVRCARIVEELEQARGAIARSRKAPSGRLRVEVASALGRHLLAPMVPVFLERYPAVRLELILRDQLVDPVGEQVDILVRIGPPRDSALMSRRLGASRGVLCASPVYLQKHGRPKSMADLSAHRCLTYLRDGRIDTFDFAGRPPPAGPSSSQFSVNDEEVIRRLALAGCGVAWLFDFLVADDLAQGRLSALLEEQPAPEWPIFALYPKNRNLLPKARVFLELLSTWLRR